MQDRGYTIGASFLDNLGKAAGVVISVCGYCRSVYGVRPGMCVGVDAALSHGACPECYRAVMSGDDVRGAEVA